MIYLELIIVDDPPEFDDHNISEYNIPGIYNKP